MVIIIIFLLWMVSMNGIELQAHRGSFNMMGNTIEGFMQAIKEGANSIEMDVQVSKDGIAFLNHDTFFDRSGDRSYVKNLTYDEFKEYAPDIVPYKEGTRFPLLLDVLEFLKAYNESTDKKVIFDLEVKSIVYETFEPHKLMAFILPIIKKSGVTSFVRIRSFDKDVLRVTKDAMPVVSLVLNTEEDNWVRAAQEVGASIVGPYFKNVTMEKVEAAHQEGLSVITWTVNDKQDYQKVIDEGVDGITTDSPDQLASFLRSKAIRQKLVV